MLEKFVTFMTLATAVITAMVATFPLDAAEITGRVVGITDGDTLTVLTGERRPEKIRLSDIDTPESNQPYGTRSRQALAELAFQKSVRVVVRDTDRYGRTIGRLYVGAADVNKEMVRQGAAWVYRQYNRDPSLLAVEAEARAAKRGLWALPEAERTPPWEWRRMAQETRRDTTPPQVQAPPPATSGSSGTAASTGFTCGGKTVCREMTSCAEARFYLSQCGLSRLDRDRDGIPCGSICSGR
jgi:endonuclease YncB( thermonuclease family)